MQAIAALKGEKESVPGQIGVKKQNNCLILEWRDDCDYQLEKHRDRLLEARKLISSLKSV